MVYSNATGALLRRIRSKNPTSGGRFGRVFTAQGSVAYVEEGKYWLNAMSLTSGALLWRYTTQSPPNSPITGKSVIIEALAVDAGRIYIGMPEAWLLNNPQQGLYAYEGMVLLLDAATGAQLNSPASPHPQSYSQFGGALAASSGYYAIGSWNYDGAAAAQGRILIGHVSGWQSEVFASDGAAGDGFGSYLASSGFSLYVGTSNANAVYHYDMRNLGLIEKIMAPSGSTGFGQSISACGHLLLIGDNSGSWLYDRLTQSLVRIFEDSKASGITVKSGMSICGDLAAGPGGGVVFRQKGVGGGRLTGSSVLAATHATAPGASGPKFASMTGEAAITDSGVAAYTGRLSGTGTTTANDAGLWSNLSGSLDLVIKERDTVDGHRVGAPYQPFFTPSGEGRYLARNTDNGALGVWLDSGMVSYPFFSEGQVVGIAGSAVLLPVSRLYGAASGSGNSTVINFSLKLGGTVGSVNDSLIGRPGLIVGVDAREGAASGITDFTYGQIAPRVAAAGARITYSSALLNRPTTTNAALFVKSSGVSDTMVLAEKGMPAHQLENFIPNSIFSSFVGEAVSAAGVVYRAKFVSGKKSYEGLWLYTGPMISNTALVAFVSGQASGTATGVRYKRFLKAFITDAGQVIYMAQLSGPGVTSANDVGIWLRATAGGAPTLVAREGDVLPSSDLSTIGTIQRLDVAGGGRWVMLASLGRCPATRNQALFVGNFSGYTLPEIVQRKGDTIDRATSSRLLGLGMGSNNCDAAGMGSKGIAKLVSNAGVVYTATFAETTELVKSTIFGN